MLIGLDALPHDVLLLGILSFLGTISFHGLLNVTLLYLILVQKHNIGVLLMLWLKPNGFVFFCVSYMLLFLFLRLFTVIMLAPFIFLLILFYINVLNALRSIYILFMIMWLLGKCVSCMHHQDFSMLIQVLYFLKF